MNDKPTPDELKALEAIWASQAKVTAAPVDFAAKAFVVDEPWSGAGPAEVEQALLLALGWPAWVRFFARPPHAVLAACALAKRKGLPTGVCWVAPGTGAPFDPPKGPPGVIMLRGDWTPSAAEMGRAAAQARAQGLLLVVDESQTGFRLPGGGAVAAFGLEPDAALFALDLPAGLPGGAKVAFLAGVGDPPETKAARPDEQTMAWLGGLARWLGGFDLAGHLAVLGRSLAVGLDFFRRQAGLDEEVFLDGPAGLPRLGGRRVWAFMEVAREEGLFMDKLVLLDARLSEDDCRRLVWPRLARAVARLRVLPEGEKAPKGWKEAGPAKCIRVEEILRGLDK